MKNPSFNTEQSAEITVKGIPASPGISSGPVFLYREPTFDPELLIIDESNIFLEIERFRKAVGNSKKYLEKICEDTINSYGKEFAELLITQITILNDVEFLNEVEQLIINKRYDAAYATFTIFKEKKEHFLRLSDEYLRERAFDIYNLKRLILKNMLGKDIDIKIENKAIVVADNISPADIIKLHHKHILGFCTDIGGKNSHTAIVARALAVPAVVGTEFITSVVKEDDEIILDGNDGIVVVNPVEKTIKSYLLKKEKFLIIEKDLLKNARKSAKTLDRHRIKVMGNIEFVEELDQLHKSGAEGIGLYRTEGLFLGDEGIPSEDHQTEVYLKIAKSMDPQKVTIRTLDIGGDKLIPEIVGIPERNPFLGWRAIRFCLDHKDIFIPQIKAILRANIYQNVQLLLPMVSSVGEILQFKEVYSEAIEILQLEGKKFNPNVEIGMMVEIPSAALLANTFAKEVDFFSIGTNDLIQYTLAVDRANEKIAHLYNHFHPAVLDLIKRVIDVGKEFNIPVTMCGEMAGDPVATPLLLGMGLEQFSASHIMISEIKNVIRHLSLSDCIKLYEKSIKLRRASKIQFLCEHFYAKIFTHPHSITKKVSK
jgi:phosphotransferase system enzyme I (PtsI)